ncbi:DUF484 family protein [Curvivirga aplysinae]|uniref:DUF484 family protein n=1 Tax=Curvivirga aplysinae TaxID=2529852 RepID=UPI0012BC8346|nr:DUF484 family protein [Curvivirga aplysinae]MTI10247.1 DUF484 family protein [Curvivirga aplysinae]
MAEHTIRAANENLTAEIVADYLRDHPDFLSGFPDLLGILQPPSREMGEGVSDLQQTMIHRLRDQVERTEDLANVMIVNSRDNLSSTTQIHECVLQLMSTESFEELLEVISRDLPQILELDCVALCVENDDMSMPPIDGLRVIPTTLIDYLLPDGEVIALRDNTMPDPNVYVEKFEVVKSEVLVRLEISPEVPPALLAFGSSDPERFDPGQGTELILFLAQSISELIRIWLALPSPEVIFGDDDDQ